MSNIKKSERKETSMDYYVLAVDIVKKLMLSVCENFGFSDLKHNLVLFEKENNFTEYDKGDIERLIKTYPALDVENRYIFNLTDEFRHRIWDSAFNLLYDITKFKGIFPTTWDQYNMKVRVCQEAITDVEYIHTLMNLLVEMLISTNKTKNINKIMGIVKDLENETKKLRSAKKACNSFKNNIRNNDINEKLRAENYEDKIRAKIYNDNRLFDIYSSGLLSTKTVLDCQYVYESNKKEFEKIFKDQDNLFIDKRKREAITFFPQDSEVPDGYFEDFRSIVTEPLFKNLVEAS